MFTWVHNCPARRFSTKKTTDSIRFSDISRWELWRHPSELTPEQIEAWWEERLLEAARRDALFLRLEDDVVVCRHIEHNVLTWPAISRPDFGVGSLFDLSGTCWYRFEADGLCYNEENWITAQGLVFRSDVVPELVERMRAIRHDATKFRRTLPLNFDQVIAAAVHDMGLKVFFHEPCLVDCVEGNGRTTTVGPAHPDHRAKNFQPDWRR